MSRPHDRRQQRKLQKAKHERELARRERGGRALAQTPEALIERGRTAPFGPCWISTAIHADAKDQPALISIIITRRVGGLLLPSIILVDRTCLGIKNAF